MSKGKNQQLGQFGEELACKYLENKGYRISDRNFRQKWGEIDIICTVPANVPRETFTDHNQSDSYVSRETLSVNQKNNVPRGTPKNPLGITEQVLSRKDGIFSKIGQFFAENTENTPKNKENKPKYKIIFVEVKTLQSKLLRPEENVTFTKQKRLIRSCQAYLSHNNYIFDTDWQIDVISILLDKNTGKAQVKHLEQAVYFG